MNSMPFENAIGFVEGRTVTYNSYFLCHFGLLWRVVSLGIIPHLLFSYYKSIKITKKNWTKLNYNHFDRIVVGVVGRGHDFSF